MRFSRFVLTAAAAGLAAWTAAAAQQESTAEPETKAEEPRLSDVERAVDEILEEAQPGETATEADPAEETPAPVAEPVAPPPAEPAQPEPQAPAGPPPPLTREQAAQLDSAVARGRLLIAVAQAGLISTQDMLSRVADPEAAGIAGWIAEPAGNAMAVTYYAQGEDGPAAVYRASVLGGRVTSRELFLTGTRPPLTRLQARMAAARAATEGVEQRACSDRPFNVFVVPPASADAPIDVYRFTAQNQRGRFPLGGHFKSTVEADGGVSATRGFTNGCLDLEADEVPAGQQPRPIAVTHLLDPLPTEIHVFMALWTGRPLIVAAGDPQRLWLVTGERIAEIRP